MTGEMISWFIEKNQQKRQTSGQMNQKTERRSTLMRYERKMDGTEESKRDPTSSFRPEAYRW